VKVSCYFEPRDLWVGMYWDRRPIGDDSCVCTLCEAFKPRRLHIYVCLLPTLVIRVIL
jgi:hypothetical protein